MINILPVGEPVRQCNYIVMEMLVIIAGYSHTMGIIVIQIFEFDIKNSGLYFV